MIGRLAAGAAQGRHARAPRLLLRTVRKRRASRATIVEIRQGSSVSSMMAITSPTIRGDVSVPHNKVKGNLYVV